MRDIAHKFALVFAALLLVVGGVALCPGTARAGDSLPDCGPNLSTQFGGDPMVLSIDKKTASGSGDMYTWNLGNYGNRPWHSIRADFMYATLGEGVTSITSYAFYDCSKLRIIAIPRTVTSIGANAILNCVSLKYVVWDGTQAEWDAFIASSAVNKTGNVLTNPGIKLIRSWDTIKSELREHPVDAGYRRHAHRLPPLSFGRLVHPGGQWLYWEPLV